MEVSHSVPGQYRRFNEAAQFISASARMRTPQGTTARLCPDFRGAPSFIAPANKRSNHVGLPAAIKRNLINWFARVRGATATLRNQAASTIRGKSGPGVVQHAQSARRSVRSTGARRAPAGASFAAANRHSSRWRERSRTAARSNSIPQDRQRRPRYSSLSVHV